MSKPSWNFPNRGGLRSISNQTTCVREGAPCQQQLKFALAPRYRPSRGWVMPSVERCHPEFGYFWPSVQIRKRIRRVIFAIAAGVTVAIFAALGYIAPLSSDAAIHSGIADLDTAQDQPDSGGADGNAAAIEELVPAPKPSRIQTGKPNPIALIRIGQPMPTPPEQQSIASGDGSLAVSSRGAEPQNRQTSGQRRPSDVSPKVRTVTVRDARRPGPPAHTVVVPVE
jgi:hypothetical protein